MTTKYGLRVLDEQELGEIENWLGAQIDLVTATANPGPSTGGLWGLIHWTWKGDTQNLAKVFGQSDRRLLGHFKMAAGDEDDRNQTYSYEKAANGAHDSGYRETARELVNAGMGDSILRPSAEFNLDWGRYPGDPQNYADAFAHVVREMMSVDGADFEFLYSPGGNRIGVADEAWPVDSQYWPSGVEAPLMAPSFYDASLVYPDDTSQVTQSDREEAWIDIRDGNLKMWEELADRLGASGMAAPEWGVSNAGVVKPNGGDNPYFMRKALEYMDGRYEYSGYWNEDSPQGGSHEIYPPDSAGLEKASQKFQEFVGQRLSGSSGDTTSSSSTAYGGYNQPTEGTANWHNPLNENFADIEADIKDLADRINQLEN